MHFFKFEDSCCSYGQISSVLIAEVIVHRVKFIVLFECYINCNFSSVDIVIGDLIEILILS